MNNPSVKLQALRKAMQENGVQGYLIPRADEFQGEFVAAYAERLKWLTGFSGSAGLAAVFEDKALMLTDGRYTAQAAGQVNEQLYEIGDYIEKKPTEWIKESVGQGDAIGYDPWLFTKAQIDAYTKAGLTLKALNHNLIDQIWDHQPPRPKGKVFDFPDDIAGRSAQDKIADIVQAINDNNAQSLIVTMPDSIAWCLNKRGQDIDYIPYILSYLIVFADGRVTWLIDPDKIDGDCAFDIHPIDDIESALKSLNGKVLLDFKSTPMAIINIVSSCGLTVGSPSSCHPELVSGSLNAQSKKMLKQVQHDNEDKKSCEVFDHKDPTTHPKSIKTANEIEAIKAAHIADGVALVKFLKWVEESQNSGMTEITAGENLHAFRAQSNAFTGDSFPTIAGFGSNGAIIHYRASAETDTEIKGDGLLLVDSGGQYARDKMYGTTDITRTIPIGKPSQEMKENFTRVLKGHIALASSQFPKGTIGTQIDTLARKELWDAGLNYAHGTGHGVGCYLAVHEDAANISPRGQVAFEPGMLISNEPGYYHDGAYGIRIENLILVVLKGDMLAFETISFAPIDKTLIVKDMLSFDELNWFNSYHAQVFDILKDKLDRDHQDWLQKATSTL